MLVRLPSKRPSSFGYFHSEKLRADIASLTKRTSFDLVLVHCSSVAHYVSTLPGVPKILDFGDMDSQKWRLYGRSRGVPLAWGYRLEGLKLQAEEQRLSTQFDLCTCTTSEELATLESYGAARRTGWFPNGVDFEYFQPTTASYDPNLICFIGRMDYFPNQQGVIEFCREALPLIRVKRPEAKLFIVGAEPPPSVRRLATIPGVTVTGTVADVRPYAHRSALTIAPLKIARGTQNKILEAMAMGIPVVASEEAAKGVEAVPGEHILTATTPEEFADAAQSVLGSQTLRQELAARALARVKERHSWSGAMARLDQLIEALLHDRRKDSADSHPRSALAVAD
jgi:sugar transferase (PEP-CTERM/EpsH1 system associated)